MPILVPTLAGKKLAEQRGHHLSAKTLKQWMIAEGLWEQRHHKATRIHQRRSHRLFR